MTPGSASPHSAAELHLVTDRRITGAAALVDAVAAAVRGGVTTVQLREKDLEGRALADLGRRLMRVCSAGGARLLINDRIDVALAVDADGVHLPANSLRIAEARALLGRSRVVGVSTHSVAEVESAAREGADYAVFGPVFETPSKTAYGPPLGIEALGRATRAGIAVIAIGGITSARLDDVRGTGTAGVAVIRAILEAADPEKAAAAFRT